MNMKDEVVGHLPKEIFKDCGLFINTEAPLLVLRMCDTSNRVICAGDQGNVGCFLGLPTGSSITYLRSMNVNVAVTKSSVPRWSK